ncbi:GDSL-type esterase/lipase family protein [Terribacillus saccharophilus]|uniref:GDSL-type esterase/lipase family protein n=1 Tax=Terribacillus saccharophilus TaxID=361277 RepID=UPI003982C3D2
MQKRKIYLIIASFLLAVVIGAVIVFAASDQKATVTNAPSEVVPTTDSSENPDEEAAASEEEADNSSDIKNAFQRLLKDTLGLFIKEDLHISAVGDSLTQGVGDETENGGYVGILQQTFEQTDDRVKIDNFGKRGNRTDQLLKRLDDPVISASIENADVVLITIGANDIMKVTKDHFTDLDYDDYSAAMPSYEERMKEVFNKIDKLNPEAEVYLIGFYNPFEDNFPELKDQLGTIMDEYNAIGKQVAEEADQHYIETADLFRGQTESLLSDDYFHPNEVGYGKVAERVLESIKPVIQEDQEDDE